MKRRTLRQFSTFILLGLFLFSTGASAQVDYDEIFNNVDTENYEIIELAEMDDNFSIFVELVEMSGLATQMEFTDRYTVLLPTNEAFKDLSKERYEELKDPQNRAELMRFIRNHFLPTEVTLMEFNETQIIETAGEEEIEISTTMNGNVVYVGGAEIVLPDISASDGVIHVVNAVVEPTADVVPE